MKESIDIIRGSRKFLVNLIDGMSIQKVNEIPAGFNNNIAWNIAHIIAAQQNLCYVNAGVKPLVEEKFIAKYKTGTKPEGFVDEAEFAALKNSLLSTIDQFEEDAPKDIFTNYNVFDSKIYPGVRIENIKDAAKFVSFHDGIHLGYIMALKRVISNNLG